MDIDFRQTTYHGLAAKPAQCPPPDRPEVVFSGRSNVGKSSLINALTDQKKLAKVSQTPGKTRAVVYFDVGGAFYLTDMPGYGYAKVSRAEMQRFSRLADHYLRSDRPIALVLHLMDIRHEPSQNDLQMIAWLMQSGLFWQLVLTKADKLSRAQQKKQLAMFTAKLGLEDASCLHPVSATKKEGIEPLRETILAVLERFGPQPLSD